MLCVCYKHDTHVEFSAPYLINLIPQIHQLLLDGLGSLTKIWKKDVNNCCYNLTIPSLRMTNLQVSCQSLLNCCYEVRSATQKKYIVISGWVGVWVKGI